MEWRLTFLCRSNLKKVSFSAGASCNSMILFFFFFFNFKLEMKPPQSVGFHNWLYEWKRHCIILSWFLIGVKAFNFTKNLTDTQFSLTADDIRESLSARASCRQEEESGFFSTLGVIHTQTRRHTHTQADTLPHRVQTSPRSSSPPPPPPSSHMDTPDDCCLGAYKDTYTRSYQL